MEVKQEKDLDRAKDLVSSMPKEEKVALLNHLLAELNDSDLQGLALPKGFERKIAAENRPPYRRPPGDFDQWPESADG